MGRAVRKPEIPTPCPVCAKSLRRGGGRVALPPETSNTEQSFSLAYVPEPATVGLPSSKGRVLRGPVRSKTPSQDKGGLNRATPRGRLNDRQWWEGPGWVRRRLPFETGRVRPQTRSVRGHRPVPGPRSEPSGVRGRRCGLPTVSRGFGSRTRLARAQRRGEPRELAPGATER